MDNETENRFTWKLIIVIGLCLLILFGLLSLLKSGKAPFMLWNQNDPKETEVPVQSPSSETDKPEETITPDIETATTEPQETETSEPALTPSETKEPEKTPESTEKPSEDPKPAETEIPEKTPEPTSEPTPDPKEKVDVYSDDSIQRIVNKKNLLPSDYVPADLVPVNVPKSADWKLRKEAASALVDMFAAAKEDGIDLFLASGYRSYADQKYIYNYYLKNRGEEWTSHVDAYPGGSEHQTGLSVDLSTTDHACEIFKCFAETDAFKWLQKHSWEYGYIERNPEGSEEYTGVQFSPWNFRYVGKTEAKKLYEAGITMEQYYFGDE